MELIYASKKIEQQCTSVKTANKLFGGDSELTNKLLSRINALEKAVCLKDIIVQSYFHFHKLENKKRKNYEGCFAIDVKSRKEPWRIILQPLDSNKQPYVPCNIDEICESVQIVEIMEVSKHYE